MILADAASSSARMSDHELAFLFRGHAVERLALLAQRGVLEVALLAAGAADEHRVDAFVGVPGDRRSAFGRLVVGVCVHGQQRQALGHVAQRICHRRRGLYAAGVRSSRLHVVAPCLIIGLVIGLATGLAACDTGDGKQLRPVDPDSTTTSTVPVPPCQVRSRLARSTPDRYHPFHSMAAHRALRPPTTPSRTTQDRTGAFELFTPWNDG